MSANDKSLEDLHTALCDHLSDVLKNGEEHVTEDGEVIRVKPKAATLSVIRQFLKDNHIEGLNRPGAPINKVTENLPFTDEQTY
jgi:hypothetical protein